MHFSDSLSSQSICWKEEATMQMSSIRQRREIENGVDGKKMVCARVERGNGPRRVRQATRNSPA